MGLDMYLEKEIYLGWDYEHNRKELGEPLPDLAKYGIKSEKISRIVESSIYWRKANAIHAWFVRNVQGGEDDCGDYYVSVEQLKTLYDTICDVLNEKSRAETLLPTQEGFFFGSTEYDSGYWGDLEYTKTELERVLNENESDNSIIVTFKYHSSW